jgi:hypothetical protein
VDVIIAILLLALILTPFGWLWWRSISRECPECLQRIDKKAKVCRYCGYRYEEQGVPAQGWYDDPDEPDRQRFWDGTR